MTAAPVSRSDEGAMGAGEPPARARHKVATTIDEASPQDSVEPSGKVLATRTFRRWTACEGQPSPSVCRCRCREPASAGYPARWRRRGLPMRPRCLVSPDPYFGASGRQSFWRGWPRKGTHTFPAAGGRRRSMKKAPRPSRNTRTRSYGKASIAPRCRPAPLSIKRNRSKEKEQPDTREGARLPVMSRGLLL